MRRSFLIPAAADHLRRRVRIQRTRTQVIAEACEGPLQMTRPRRYRITRCGGSSVALAAEALEAVHSRSRQTEPMLSKLNSYPSPPR